MPRYLSALLTHFAFLTLVGLPLTSQSSQSSQSITNTPFVISGVTSNSGSAISIQNFVAYLNQHTHLKLQIQYAESYTDLSNIMRKNSHAICWTCGAPYVEDAQNDQQQLVSVPLFNQQPTYHSLIITARNRPEKNLSDFKGQLFVYSDIRSNSGFIAPSIQLKKQNIDIHHFFSLMINAGNHENSIIALYNGLADVAAIDEYVWIQYTLKHPEVLKELHEIERTGPFPFTPIVAAKNVSKKNIKLLQDTLTQMNKAPKGKQILSSLGLDGFINKPVSFYQPIEKMLQLLKIQAPTQ